MNEWIDNRGIRWMNRFRAKNAQTFKIDWNMNDVFRIRFPTFMSYKTSHPLRSKTHDPRGWKKEEEKNMFVEREQNTKRHFNELFTFNGLYKDLIPIELFPGLHLNSNSKPEGQNLIDSMNEKNKRNKYPKNRSFLD